MAYRLMSRAFRTLVAMNLLVTWIAMSKRVRSPVAAAPSRSWSSITCLRGASMSSLAPEHIRTHLLKVIRSVLGGCSETDAIIVLGRVL